MTICVCLQISVKWTKVMNFSYRTLEVKDKFKVLYNHSNFVGFMIGLKTRNQCLCQFNNEFSQMCSIQMCAILHLIRVRTSDVRVVCISIEACRTKPFKENRQKLVSAAKIQKCALYSRNVPTLCNMYKESHRQLVQYTRARFTIIV